MSKTDILYNGTCPVCSREIAHYRRLSTACDLPHRYDDLADAENLRTWGVDAADAARRLHVRKDGRTHIGVPAFIALWEGLPGYRWLARFVRLPGIFFVASWAYDRILAPLLYQRHVKRQSESAATDAGRNSKQ
ncbi:thiol-disulfide oxidoreductase DCC family protein [uncultured Roseobacter sp.]|uniref:thiol-disulfide oxidoreductase DCC family protein n=1 Tax=uncultured Roseobacter sp. TaxID=114847 RepID=UPI0026355830|nr:DUF393 domain-containing protein [uncultured Roseobacter sp.]